MGIEYETQIKHPLIERLRFDFRFILNSITYYIEFDGKQHHMYISHFHSEYSFESGRQRDLIKNYVVFHTPNEVLIRLDYRWVKFGYTKDILKLYIESCIQSKLELIGDPGMYPWLFDVPEEDSLKEYIIGHTKIVTVLDR